MNLENNLFYYATGELSQDAFLCWLLSHSIKGLKKDNNIRDYTIDFLKAFIPALAKEDCIYLSYAPEKQVNKVDV